ncbi:Oidioi.mRNA.OKI2018_I69.chr2.g4385.t1.cds [Oikopleura dioica]|uniref:Oidioi.mRNA.OKI2018_I69.chr2.g4385.t1.cds n=1 Tax=Oikopleura dioica TaxID=34765 RepID=A0ABN7T0L9_OIKDI|nr:Oidioi.mRNA.OKI2018_I69.chr2.g4385.t1.cds [Oikopleura dioica]
MEHPLLAGIPLFLDAFNSIADEEGKVSRAKFFGFLKKELGDQAEELLARVDENEEGMMDFKEFCFFAWFIFGNQNELKDNEDSRQPKMTSEEFFEFKKFLQQIRPDLFE